MTRASVRHSLALALSLGLATGCSSAAEPTATSASPPASSAPSPNATAPGQQDQPNQPVTSAAAPVRVTVPSLGINSSLMRLGLNKDGTVEVPPPEKGMTAGWYTGAPAPGEPGAAVIIGHNETRDGRAVFKDLKKIAKGAEITVRNTKGVTARFTVTRTETVKKTAFPTERVYGPTDSRELRLITCDGGFDAAGHPVDNLIVYATLR
ncbi:class F sortase [Streptomyces sp. NPDC004838]